MYPSQVAEKSPGRTAVIVPDTGEQITYAQLAARVNQLAHAFRAAGLGPGSHAAVLTDNIAAYVETVWAAHVSGIILTPVNNKLTAREAAYIINDCGAKLVVGSAALSPLLSDLVIHIPDVPNLLVVGGEVTGWESYEATRDTQPTTPIEDECKGAFMFYSSGTTGRPKGIARQWKHEPLANDEAATRAMSSGLGLGGGEVDLVPSPLFHSAPSNWTVQRMHAGDTVVLMQRFDPEAALRFIDKYRVTFVQFVPTHMNRLVRLPKEVRDKYDVSSLKIILHAAAPCPVAVKKEMIEWVGPIVNEYYGATEANGGTWITSKEWLERPGSVGRATGGGIHILDDEGNELPPMEPGAVWFDGGRAFEYHNDPEQTDGAYNDKGYSTVGDLGYLDPAGYLFLTDRKSNMIISGGVNVYPQEAENEIASLPKVADVAVIGVPHSDMGEEVKAFVQPVHWDDATDEVAAEIIAHCRSRLADYKCPRSVEFRKELPRTDAGKLLKRLLREEFQSIDAGGMS